MTDKNKQAGLSTQEEESVVSAVEEVTAEEHTAQDAFLTTSTGVVIRAKLVPETLVSRAYSQYPEIDPPMVEIKQGSKTYTQPNYDDPGYVRRNTRRVLQIGEVILRLRMLYGMEIVSLPEGMLSYEEDTGWVDELEAAGLIIPPEEKTVARKLEWIRLRILPTNSDLTALNDAENKLEGISEEDVKAAMALFRRTGGWSEPQPVA